jgi:hypothetical protein
VVVNPIAAQTPENELANARRAVYAYALKIEGYRVTNGRLPQTLAEAGVVAAVDYTVVGGNYQLAATVGENEVVYSSTEALQAWATRTGVSFEIGG